MARYGNKYLRGNIFLAWNRKKRVFFSETLGNAESLKIFLNLPSYKTTQHALLFLVGKKEKPRAGAGLLSPVTSRLLTGLSEINETPVGMLSLSSVPHTHTTNETHGILRKNLKQPVSQKISEWPWEVNSTIIYMKIASNVSKCQQSICVCSKLDVNRLPQLHQKCRLKTGTSQPCSITMPS